MMTSAPTVELADANRLQERLPQLIALLQDAVNQGASVGFFAPLADAPARAYWQDVAMQVAADKKMIWLAEDSSALLGAVQLEPCKRENGLQRAEVQKLFVLNRARQRGIAASLMKTLEQTAFGNRIRTLHLDTEEGSPAEAFYQRLGYHRIGAIPDYAHASTGQPCATAIYYKQLSYPIPKEAA